MVITKHIIYSIFFIFVACSTTYQKNPLIGRWKSNKVETIKEIQNCGEYSKDKVLLIISKIDFGELVLEIDEKNISSYYHDFKDVGEYKIINIDGDFITIETSNSLTGKKETSRIEVRNDKMWMPSSIIKFREVFDRID